jgi:itaconate CoA-transferase
MDLLEATSIGYAQLNEMSAFSNHLQLKARSRWRPVATEAGMVDMLLPPFNLDEFSARMDPIPSIGENSQAILGELGFSGAEIDQLRRSSVI